MAAVLACGSNAVLSHRSALALWGLTKKWPVRYEVIAGTDRRRAGVVVHQSRTLTPTDTTTQLGIPVTTPARTLYDCAATLTDRTINDALLSPYLTRHQLAELLQRLPSKRLEAFVSTDDGPTRSQFEDAFKEFCETHGLPRPRINVEVAGYEVDALFPTHKLIVELDGYRYHSTRQAFERDRERDAVTLSAGYRTVRITWTRMTQAPRREAGRLLRILQA